MYRELVQIVPLLHTAALLLAPLAVEPEFVVVLAAVVWLDSGQVVEGSVVLVLVAVVLF